MLSAGLLGTVILVAGSATAGLLDGQLSATPLPILSSTSSIVQPITSIALPTSTPVATTPTTSAAAPTTSINPTNALPTIGDGNAVSSSPAVTTSNALPTGTTSASAAGTSSSAPPTGSQSISGTTRASTTAPAYSGGFYTKGPSGASGVIGAADGQSGPLGDAAELIDGALAGEDGASSGDATDSQAGTGAENSTKTSAASIPGPAIGIIVVLLAAFVLVLSRRRLH